MSANDPHANDPHADESRAESSWFGRRKRIIAREVPRDASGGEPGAPTNAAAHEARQGIVTDEPHRTDSRGTEAVLDPTLLGERHRKSGHQFVYRLAQGATLLAFAAAATSIAFAIAANARGSQMLAIGASVLATLCLCIVRTSRLVYRLRGYIAAACVLSAIALGLSFMPGLFRDDGKPVPHAAPKPPPPGMDPA